MANKGLMLMEQGGVHVANKGQKSTKFHESYGGPTTSVQEVGEVQTSTPPATINIPPSPSFL